MNAKQVMDSRISSISRLTGMRLKELVLLDHLGVHILCCHSQILDLDIASVSHRVHDSALPGRRAGDRTLRRLTVTEPSKGARSRTAASSAITSASAWRWGWSVVVRWGGSVVVRGGSTMMTMAAALAGVGTVTLEGAGRSGGGSGMMQVLHKLCSARGDRLAA
jgi:hypothetical protein